MLRKKRKRNIKEYIQYLYSIYTIYCVYLTLVLHRDHPHHPRGHISECLPAQGNNLYAKRDMIVVGLYRTEEIYIWINDSKRFTHQNNSRHNLLRGLSDTVELYVAQMFVTKFEQWYSCTERFIKALQFSVSDSLNKEWMDSIKNYKQGIMDTTQNCFSAESTGLWETYSVCSQKTGHLHSILWQEEGKVI